MKHNAGSTLLTTNKLGVITETDQHYLEAVKAFARLSYESIYVIDYYGITVEKSNSRYVNAGAAYVTNGGRY